MPPSTTLPQILGWLVGARASQAVAGEIDPVRVVDDAIEDGVGVGGIADQLVPFVEGDLAGDDGRAAAVTFFEDFEEVVTSGGIEGLSRRSTNHGVACRSPHVLLLVNQEAVTDQRCPSARTNSTTTKLAIATQGRRIVTLATVPKSHARSTTPKTPTTRGSRPRRLEGPRR